MATLVQIDAYDPVAATAVSLCATSHDDPEACHAPGATCWWPTLAKLPTLKYDLFDGAFEGQITAPSSTLTLQTEPWPDFACYSFADARLRIWTGGASSGGAWTLRFDGRVTAQPNISNGVASIDFAADDAWLDAALLTTYAGTTGAEGPSDFKGQAKPLAIGAPRYVAGKLIDSVNSVFQMSSYGAVQSIDFALEKLSRFSAAVGDYASYDALVAASLPAGTWATAKTVGMARFGAPPAGQISFLLAGDTAGPNGWARLPGQVIRRIALLSGGAGKIDDASLDALDAARPYPISVYVDAQTTARTLIQSIAASVNAVAGVSWLGKLFVAPVGLGTPTVTLAADGSALPPVSSVAQIDIASPWRKLAIGAERAWTVHALGDIAFTATLVPLGAYATTTTYREGNIVTLADGSSWLYVATTPTSGNAPALGSPYWSREDGSTVVDWKLGITGAGKPGDGATRNDDGANMIPAPNDPTTWLVTGTAVKEATGYSGRPADANRTRFPGDGDTVFWCGVLPAVPGETLYARHVVYFNSGVPDASQVIYGYQAIDSTGTVLGQYSVAGLAVAGAGIVRATWVVRTGLFVTPSGTAFVRPYAQRGGGGGDNLWVGEPYLGRSQPGADITAQSQHTITLGASSIDFSADYQGNLLLGQISRSIGNQRKVGTVDVSTATAWSASPTGGITCSIDNSGVLTFTAVANGSVTISGAYAGVVMQAVLTVTKTNAPPPITGGGGSGSGSGSGAPTSATSYYLSQAQAGYINGTTDIMTVAAGASGQIDLTASVDFNLATLKGSDNCYGKWQYRPVGGTFADVGGENVSSFGCYTPPKPGVGDDQSDGHIDTNTSIGGLTNGTVYELRWVWRSADSRILMAMGPSMPLSTDPVAHWAVTDRKTGEHHFARCAGDGIPPGYDRDAHDFIRLEREPSEHDAFDGKSLTCCEIKKAERLRVAELNALSNAQLYDRIMADIRLQANT